MMRRLERIEGSGVQKVALQVALYLEALTGRRAFQPSDNDGAIWITDGKRIISLLIWREWEEEECGWIGLGWTNEEYRRKGLYRSLVEEFKRASKSSGLKKIGCGIDSANLESLTVHRALGMVDIAEHVVTLEAYLG